MLDGTAVHPVERGKRTPGGRVLSDVRLPYRNQQPIAVPNAPVALQPCGVPMPL